jgi:hypothetical protein
MNGNEKFGIKKIDLCHSRLGCEPNDIGKNVILAPWWEPDMFRDSVEDIYLLQRTLPNEFAEKVKPQSYAKYHEVRG